MDPQPSTIPVCIACLFHLFEFLVRTLELALARCSLRSARRRLLNLFFNRRGLLRNTFVHATRFVFRSLRFERSPARGQRNEGLVRVCGLLDGLSLMDDAAGPATLVPPPACGEQ